MKIPKRKKLLSVMCVSRKWERAAIVWAYVGEGKTFETPEHFAELGIISLSSRQFVQKYWDRWQSAIDSGHAKPVEIGDEFTVPDLPWTTTGNRHMLNCSCGCKDRTPWAGR